MSSETYPMPEHGWNCFHCGENFTTVGGARDHFGADPTREPGCLIRLRLGERGLEMELRKREESEDEWKSRAIAAEDHLEVAQGSVAEFERIAGGDVHQLRMKLDSLQGELIAANAIRKELGEQFEFDRSKVAECVTAANRALESRAWLMTGRGAYSWDDDRWHREFRTAAEALLKSLAPLTKIAADLKNCPRTADEVAIARIDLKNENEQLRRWKAEQIKSLIGAEVAGESRTLTDDSAVALNGGEKTGRENQCPARSTGRPLARAEQNAMEANRKPPEPQSIKSDQEQS